MKMRKKKPYFEEWYFREQNEKETLCFTVRINYDEMGKATGRLQIQAGKQCWNLEYAHPVNMNLKDSLFLVLDKSVFTEVCIHLDIEEPGLYIKGDIYFEEEVGKCRVSLKRKIWAMEQALSGELVVNGKSLSFENGKGFLEERKGRLPEPNHGFLYTQCNWFGQRPFRIVCGGSKNNCFAVIDQDGYPIRLATWKGAKLEYTCGAGFRMRQGRYVLEGWCAAEKPSSVRYRLSHQGDVLFDEISTRAVYKCVSI